MAENANKTRRNSLIRLRQKNKEARHPTIYPNITTKIQNKEPKLPNVIDNSKINVVMLSQCDWANAGLLITNSINKYSSIFNVILITYARHSSPILQWPDNKLYLTTKIARGKFVLHAEHQRIIQHVINNADIIHFKGDEPPLVLLPCFEKYIDCRPIYNKPWVITVEGKAFRRCSGSIGEVIAQGRWGLPNYTNHSIARTVVSPDLNYKEFDGIWVPHPIDSSSIRPTWKWTDPPIIAHSPSSRLTKGTDDFFIPAIKQLKQCGCKFEIDIIENVSLDTCIQRKSSATIFFDQKGIGFYALAAIEAGIRGIPVVAWMSKEAVVQSGGMINNKCPVINFEPTITGLAKSIKKLLCSDDHLVELSKTTREWFIKTHDSKNIVKIWEQIYQNAYDEYNH